MTAAKTSLNPEENSNSKSMTAPEQTITIADTSAFMPKGYDPELLYVECSRCGAPVVWEKGRTTKLLEKAGIDPLELDSSCELVTDGCPMCTQKGQYMVQMVRLSSVPESRRPLLYGKA